MTLRDQILRLLDEWPSDDAIPTAGEIWGMQGAALWYQVVDALGDAEADGLLVLQDCSAGMAVRLTEAGRKAAEEARP